MYAAYNGLGKRVCAAYSEMGAGLVYHGFMKKIVRRISISPKIPTTLYVLISEAKGTVGHPFYRRGWPSLILEALEDLLEKYELEYDDRG